MPTINTIMNKLLMAPPQQPTSIPLSESELAKQPSVSVEEEALKRKKELENLALEQDIELKRQTLSRLFLFLALETAVIFLFAFLQAIHQPWNFGLEDWSFRLLIAATIIQITLMIQIAVKHLFPTPTDRAPKI